MASLEERLSQFLTVRQVIVLPVSTLSSMFLVYGFYVLLFGATVRTLLSPIAPNRGAYLGMTVALFTFATVHVVIQCWSAIRQAIIDFNAAKTRDYAALLAYNNRDNMKTVHFAFLNIVPILINLTAEAMLIHRCYTIWNSRKRVGIPLLLGSIVMNAIGLSSAIMGIVAFSDRSKPSSPEVFKTGDEILSGWALASLSFNGFVTILTAARIWYITRDARKMMGEDVRKRYEIIVAIILESGILYPTVQLARTILAYTYPATRGPIPIDLGAVSTQVAGIAPTLIIARAASERAVRRSHPTTTTTAASTMQFRSGRGSRTSMESDIEPGQRDTARRGKER